MLKSLCCGAIAAFLAASATAQEKTSEEREDYRCGDSKLAVWTVQDYEEQHVVIWFLAKDGKPFRPNITAPGTFISLCRNGAFLLLDTTGAHYATGPSFLMSSRGDVLGSFDFAMERSHGVTRDGSLIWVQSYDGKEGAWRTRLKVIDAKGQLIHNQLYADAIDVTVSYEGRMYKVAVLKPDMPY